MIYPFLGLWWYVHNQERPGVALWEEAQQGIKNLILPFKPII